VRHFLKHLIVNDKKLMEHSYFFACGASYKPLAVAANV